MKSDFVKAKAGGCHALGRLLGITASAVSQWGDEVPELRQYQLRKLKPHWFRQAKPTDGKAA